MINRFLAVVFVSLAFFLPTAPLPAASAQQQRPLPHPITPLPAYERAVERGTRTASGSPGENYWQNDARYEIDAVLSPQTRELRADGRIRYVNNSPDRLTRVYLHLRQNLHRPDAMRNRTVPVTDGVRLASVEADGEPLVERPSRMHPGYHVDGTILRVELPRPLASGDSVDLRIAWSFEVPGTGAPRMGQDGEVYYLGFWYPQMAVYDDVVGWSIDQYRANGEFYMGFADYDVRITVPERWLVAGTGILQNPGDVLAPDVLDRLAEASSAGPGTIVHVVDAAGRDTATVRSATGTTTWHFSADNVRDFAFGTSNRYVWDATVARVPGADHVMIHALYRPGTPAWDRSAEYLQWSVESLSERLIPYPFPQMTIVEGIISGGMEYPMITLIGGNRTPTTLFRTTFHEVAHMWYPMLVSQNEKAYAWMDEGLVSLLTDDAMVDFWGEEQANFYYRYYRRVAGTGMEVESMRHSDVFPHGTQARTAALYGKPVVAMRALQLLLGEERVEEALQAYTERWSYRHPYPWDLFRAFEDVIGQDLEWFWSALFHETWTLDHAIAAVEPGPGGVEVRVEDRDLLPLPAVVQATYEDGRQETRTVPVEHWLSGETQARLTFPAGNVVRVELDPSQRVPDLNRANDVWKRD